MKPISDALELLTAQHEEIADLVSRLQAAADQRTLDLLVEKLATHLAVEQMLLYPLAATAIRRDVLDEVHHEHVAIRQLLAELVWMGVDDPLFDDKLANLESLVWGHCGWQEDQLFQQLAEAVGADALAALGQRLVDHEHVTLVSAAA
jgi:hypothetical protein